MGGIHDLLARWGFVRLADYGLVLTPDKRILSTRPAVLDDGHGGRVVGWLASDLAAAELDRHGEERPAIVPPIVPTLPRLPKPAPAPGVVARPIVDVTGAALVAAAVMPVASIATATLAVATLESPPTPDEEDDWQWEIAMARARAVADEVAGATPPAPVTRTPVTRTPVTRTPIPRVATITKAVDPVALAELAASHREDVTRVEPIKLAAAPHAPRTGTVIPVPVLPVATVAQPVRPLDLDAPRRFPRSTNQQLSSHAPRRSTNQISAMADDDRTRPRIKSTSAVRR